MKKFDCVEMKHKIQQKILEETEGLSDEERRRRTTDSILSDPVLGPFWRNARRMRSEDPATTAS
jgi:hypothetical protein